MKDIHALTHTELLQDWKAGNRDAVIANLARRHPAVAVTFVVVCAQDGDLSLGDANAISNMLNDDLMKVRDEQGLEATQRNFQ